MPAGRDDESVEDLSIHPRPVARPAFVFGLLRLAPQYSTGYKLLIDLTSHPN